MNSEYVGRVGAQRKGHSLDHLRKQGHSCKRHFLAITNETKLQENLLHTGKGIENLREKLTESGLASILPHLDAQVLVRRQATSTFLNDFSELLATSF